MSKLSTKFFFLIVLFSSLTLFISGCKDDDNDNPTGPGGNGGDILNASGELTFNGEGFSNKKYNVSWGYAGTQNDTGYVYLACTSTSDSLYIVMNFEGSGTGTKTISEDNDNWVVAYDYLTGTGFASSSGTISISKVENVGGKVEGSLNCQMLNVATELNPVTVTGNFSVVRIPWDN